MKLYSHQSEALNSTSDKNRVAYYHDMGLGKTYTGSEKMIELRASVNLVICQKSKIQDWIDHFKSNYATHDKDYMADNVIFDLTNKKEFEWFLSECKSATEDWYVEDERTGLTYRQENLYPFMIVGVINYELAFRRPELSKLKDFTLMLDESSLIQNEQAKRTKFILKKLQPANVILLSGTPTGGKYENLWSQLTLLGWNISKTTYWNTYIQYHFEDYGGFPVKVIDGYKNVDRLKRKMREYGCHFLMTDDVMELPEQVFTTVRVPVSKEYRKFKKDRVVTVGNTQLVGDNTLTAMLYERQLCGQYNADKLIAFDDLVQSTDDRLIVFYNFTAELDVLLMIANTFKRPVSIVNGQTKDLTAYENKNNSITFIQYQAGAMGLNLQKANKIIYYSPPLSSELYEQSKKRINRIGATKTSYYYNLVCSNSIEEKIYSTLSKRRDFTNALFEELEEL